MRQAVRAEAVARACLTAGALLPYWRLLRFSTLYVTDDVFASDIFNGELPGRVLVGQLLRHQQPPVWTSALCSGTSLGGAAADPISLALFALLPPAAALDLLIVVLLLVAAHGTYGLARRFGAGRPGAVLAAISFAGSGVIAAQLKHLSIVSTVVWLPVGLSLLDRALAPDPHDGEAPGPGHDRSGARLTRRGVAMAAFGLVFANQTLAGFPQSTYICALVYGAFAVFRVLPGRRQVAALRVPLLRLGGIGVATALGAAGGAVVLLPLAELGGVSDRASGLGYAWATRLAYWPPNVLTFVIPYIQGDISNGSYVGRSLFWEDYGYVGLATFVLALYAAIRGERRRPLTAFVIGMTFAAYLIVLGPATPVFRVVYELVPGMQVFRFPTRFLVVVELGLALLAAIGLTRYGGSLQRRFGTTNPRAARWIPLAICAGTAVDLLIHQPRQNPMVAAREWLAAPQVVAAIHAGGGTPRTFTPSHRELHIQAFEAASGWANLEPYYRLRELLQPNLGGGFWNTPSADCYAGIAPRWFVDVWGDHNREGLVTPLTVLDTKGQALRAGPPLERVLRTYGVTHLLSAYPLQGAALPLVSRSRDAWVYRIEGAARVRFVDTARRVASDQEAATRLLDPDFNPDREILLHDAAASVAGARVGSAARLPRTARVVVTREDSRVVVIEAEAPADGFLLLADTFYPGWRAEVDGRATPMYRANLSVRGIELPGGRHEVRFIYEAPAFYRGLWITLGAVCALTAWLAIAATRRCGRGGSAGRGHRLAGGTS